MCMTEKYKKGLALRWREWEGAAGEEKGSVRITRGKCGS